MGAAEAAGWTAFAITAVALLAALALVFQQYVSTASGMRKCDSLVWGPMPGKSGRRKWVWQEMRFRVVFDMPNIFIPTEYWWTPGVPRAWSKHRTTSLAMSVGGRLNVDLDAKDEFERCAEACWASYVRQLNAVSPSLVQVGFLYGDMDHIPSNLCVAPMQCSVRDVIALSLMLGMRIRRATYFGTVEMSGPHGSITSGHHKALGETIHFSPVSKSARFIELSELSSNINKSWFYRLQDIATVARKPYPEDARVYHQQLGLKWRDRGQNLRKTGSPYSQMGREDQERTEMSLDSTSTDVEGPKNKEDHDQINVGSNIKEVDSNPSTMETQTTTAIDSFKVDLGLNEIKGYGDRKNGRTEEELYQREPGGSERMYGVRNETPIAPEATSFHNPFTVEQEYGGFAADSPAWESYNSKGHDIIDLGNLNEPSDSWPATASNYAQIWKEIGSKKALEANTDREAQPLHQIDWSKTAFGSNSHFNNIQDGSRGRNRHNSRSPSPPLLRSRQSSPRIPSYRPRPYDPFAVSELREPYRTRYYSPYPRDRPHTLTFFWAAQIDVEIGPFASPWKSGMHDKSSEALEIMVDIATAALSDLSAPVSSTSGAQGIRYVNFPGNELLDVLWAHLQGGGCTWPAYAMNGQGGTTEPVPRDRIQFVAFPHEPLPPLLLVDTVAVKTSVRPGMPTHDLMRERLVELASIDHWLSHAAMTNAVASDKINLVENTASILEELWTEFWKDITDVVEEKWDTEVSSKSVRRVGKQMIDYVNLVSPTKATQCFLWVAFLRATKVWQCLDVGPNTVEALRLFEDDTLVYMA